MNRVIWWPSGVFENKSHLKVMIFLSFHEQGRILNSLYTCISQPRNKISHLYYLFVFARYLLEITPLKLDIRKLGTKHKRKQRNIVIADWWRNTFNTEERTASSFLEFITSQYKRCVWRVSFQEYMYSWWRWNLMVVGSHTYLKKRVKIPV